MAAQRGSSDSDKLNPTHVTSTRGHMLDQRPRHQDNQDDDDKLLDVVGPPQSPLLPLGHSLSSLHGHPHSGNYLNLTILFIFFYNYFIFLISSLV